MLIQDKFLPSIFCAAALLCAPALHAQTSPGTAQGAPYVSVPPAAASQAQVVYFRAAPEGWTATSEAAHIYVNGQFHTALPTDTFTHFCVAPGSYTLEGYVGDGPVFAGKANPRTRVQLEGGKTYFAAVGNDGEPIPTMRGEAEKQLANSVQQRRFVSRASAVIACEERAQNERPAQTPSAAPTVAPPQIGHRLKPAVLALAHVPG